ncbi:MAG: putative inner rane transporter YedA [Verrucomicrobiota bacterium]
MPVCRRHATPAVSEKIPSRSALIVAFATIYLVWGSTYLAIKVAVGTIPPFLMAGARFLVAGTMLYAWLWFTKKIRPTPRQWFDNAIIGGLLLLGGNGLVSWASETTPSSITTLIISIGPLFIVLADWLVLAVGGDATRGAKPTLATLGGLALGFGGLALLVGPDLGSEAATRLDPWRVGAILFGCVTWSAGSIYTRYARQAAEPMTAAALQMVTGGFWLMLVSILCGEPARFDAAAISAASAGAWLYLVCIGSLVGFTTFVWLMKNCSPARVSTYAYVNPVVAVFLGWLILSEPVGPRMLAASAVIITAVAIITAQKNRKQLAVPPRQAVATTSPARDT